MMTQVPCCLDTSSRELEPHLFAMTPFATLTQVGHQNRTRGSYTGSVRRAGIPSAKTFWRALTLALAGLAFPVASLAQADYPGALWNPADSTNFSVSNRPTSPQIRYVVIHITEGSYSGAISWFRNPASNVSAHYVLRSSDGQVTQMVRERDIAWHAGVWSFNQTSVGIEHEATSLSTAWYTDALYRSSAQLTRYLTAKYAIPRTRSWIVGHKETGAATSCPGPHWDWNRYMGLVNAGATFVDQTFPTFLLPGQTTNVVVRFRNDGPDAWLPTGTDPVSLGTSPVNRSSPFFLPGNWITSARPANVFAATAPASTGEFRFSLRAPASPGIYTEAFQLSRPSIGPFGPVIQVTMGVGQLDQVIDNTDRAVSWRGEWTTATSATDKYGTDYRFATAGAKTAAQAVWALDAPRTGWYDVYAWWPQGTNRSRSAVFQISDRRSSMVRVMDQTTGGGRWNLLGRVALSGSGGWVRLDAASTDAGRVVMADAIRLVGPFDTP